MMGGREPDQLREKNNNFRTSEKKYILAL